MSKKQSTTLDAHFKKKGHTLSHLEYLDNILGNIHKCHFDKVMEMRKDIELALLNNPESKNSVVSYLSTLTNKLKDIQNTSHDEMNTEIYAMAHI